MWEIVKFFLMCVGFCCLVSAAALAYMIYKDDPRFVMPEPEEYWEGKRYK